MLIMGLYLVFFWLSLRKQVNHMRIAALAADSALYEFAIQVLGLAKTMESEPRLVIADEPTVNLDSKTARTI